MLRRLIGLIPIDKLEDISEVFSLLTAHSRAVQRAAYTLLHRYIPHAQEQVSFDVALSKSAVSLPDELVSLLLETPSMQIVAMSYGDDKMWTSLRSYLLSWKVIFDHFSNAVCLRSIFGSQLPLTLTLRSHSLSKNTMRQTSRKITS